MTAESILAFVLEWNRIPPPQLQGYVGAVVELALFIESKHIEFYPPRVVWVTSAPISAVQRALLERVFCAPVYDQYGCCEVPHIAAQCECRGGLHVNTERVCVEFVDEYGRWLRTGEWGRMLLTRYDDGVFPLIRYEVGDTGRYLRETCLCGRTLPLIDQVKGRLTDMIRLPSGRVLSGDYLTTLFDTWPDAVRGFRVVQRKDFSITIEYVASGCKSIGYVADVVKKILEEKVGHEVPVLFEKVDSIPHDRGKLRFVIREE
jgi:phenylacetate-CoA ligase